MARRAIRVCDLAEPETLSAKLDELLLHHNTLLAGLGAPTFDKADLLKSLLELAPKILPFAEPVWERLAAARLAGSRILFEGAQAVMLDVDHGTYPFVTSSNTVAGTAASGSGMGPDAVGRVLGIAKAYTTRVGSGPFPTELHDETGTLLGERGHEFGTVTGRKRRCGWFDAALVRQAVKVGGVNGLALTKLDVLDGFKTLKIGTGYMIDGTAYKHLPAGMAAQAAATPIYEDAGRLGQLHPRRPLLGGTAGGGDQICEADRGTGGSAGDPALHQPGTRRHHPRPGPVRELNDESKKPLFKKSGAKTFCYAGRMGGCR